ncbi:MAG: enoyl-ACP reductase FabI [Thermoleophilaceae bacterium]|nr:enoyl-ACP reductase FabI [Thermoleophilaceae bacterium]
MILFGRRILITGVVNTDSIAFAVAQRAQALGANLMLTAFPRDRSLTEQAAARLDHPVPIVDLDVTDPDGYAVVGERIAEEFGQLDGALHAVAFAPRDALGGQMTDAVPESVNLSFQTSVFSLAQLAGLCRDHAPEEGASVVALGFHASGAWPTYNWMGVCKSALESTTRYLARDMGPSGIRVNVVSSGPMHTRAAGGIEGFEQLLEAWEVGAPMHWDALDPLPVADAVCFLMSRMSRAISGEVLHVDGGFHAMAAPLRSAA